jgi:hypothetical protein
MIVTVVEKEKDATRVGTEVETKRNGRTKIK